MSVTAAVRTTPTTSAPGSLDRARAGDEAAFAELVEHHGPMVYSIALHSLGDRDLAEETAQEVFLALYRSLASIQSRAHLVNWLRRSTTNLVIDRFRRRRLPTVALETVAEPGAEARRADPWLTGRLRRLLGELSTEARVILTLRFQEDLGPSAIAELLDIPVNTVKSHLRRALARLRDRLAPSIGGPRP